MLATRQHGVVSLGQLRELGLTRQAVALRAKAGRLHRLHRGVYAVGHRDLTIRSRWMAAVLACGPSAVLSHRAALALWELRPVPSGPIDVTCPGRGSHRRKPGIRLHATRVLPSQDVTVVDGIPLTSVARALLDDMDDLVPWSRSELGRQVLELIREAGLPEPQVNMNATGTAADFYWPAQRLVLEADSWGFHRNRACSSKTGVATRSACSTASAQFVSPNGASSGNARASKPS